MKSSPHLTITAATTHCACKLITGNKLCEIKNAGLVFCDGWLFRSTADFGLTGLRLFMQCNFVL